MIASPLHRPLCGPVATKLTDARVSAPASGTTWDAANKGAGITLSGGDLVATTIADDSPRCGSTATQSTGKRVLRFVCVYPSTPDFEEIYMGLAVAGWDRVANIDYRVACDGIAVPGGNLGLEILSTHAGFIRANFDTGNGWFDDESETYKADAEAGTNPHFTFDVNEPLQFACELWSATADPVSLTVDTTYSSGTFAAWDS